MIFRAKQFEFNFPRPALIMGILNVTPDSFSDGGQFTDVDTAVSRALKMVEQGAEIIDVGGESTRPQSIPVSAEEEMNRVLPVIEKLASQLSIPISIDTMKPEVAKAAVQAGASIINDVAGNREDDKMWRVVAETGAGYVLMHMQGTPQTMQLDPKYDDVVAEVNEFFGERLDRLRRIGVDPDCVVLDVGIGFGKRGADNLQLLQGLRKFTKWQRPLLIGVSRKSFIGQLLGTKVTERLPASLACACWSIEAGVQIIRVHDVQETRQAVRMTEALLKQ